MLVGPSGCGKSTLLRMIAGLEAISGGEIRIGGRVVNDVMPKDRDIAMVFQNYALYPHKTVAENMGFSLKIKGAPKAEIDAKVSKAAEILDLGNLLDRYPKQLSGGQRQRVAMGRAIVRDPQVFLFDEPLSNLDAKLRVAMRVEIKELHQRLKTTIDLRHPRPDRGDDDGRQDRRDARRPRRADRRAARSLRPAGQRLRRRLHRLAGDELRQGQARLERRRPDLRRRDSGVGAAGRRRHRAAAASRSSTASVPSISRSRADGLPATVSVLEPTGSETQVFARLGDDAIDAIVKDRLKVRPGDEIPFRIDPGMAHIFDGRAARGCNPARASTGLSAAP